MAENAPMRPIAIVHRPGLVVVGIQVRTANRDEANPGTARIPALWARWANVAADLPPRTETELYAVYSDYESDHLGAYSLTIGHAVAPETVVPPEMARVVVPSGRYAVVTTRRGAMPGIVREAWQRVWAASDTELGGRRAFTVDYEVYDERSRDPADAEVDLHLSVF
jgi:predicted transcriptional regulator YdeE